MGLREFENRASIEFFARELEFHGWSAIITMIMSAMVHLCLFQQKLVLTVLHCRLFYNNHKNTHHVYVLFEPRHKE